MSLDQFIFYLEGNIAGIVLMGIMLINDRYHSMRQEKQLWFNRTLIAHMLYFANDVGWAAVLSGVLPRTRILMVLFNFLNYVLLSLVAYEWFMYMAASENMDLVRSRRKRILCLTPMILSVTVLIICYISAPLFWIDETGNLNPLYYPMMIAVPILYLLAAFTISMINAGKTESRADKHLYRLIGIYPLSIIGFGVLQLMMLTSPLMCFGCTIMMVFFYIQNMQMLVSVDSLTRLNNRGQIDRYVEQTRYRENERAYAMMMDIDHFKKINDTYGHAEGDRALILLSETLKQTAEQIKTPMFIGRYGGDEFAVFLQTTENDQLPEQVSEMIRTILHEKQQASHLPYDLRVSIGYDVLRDKNDTMAACLARADENLYQNKYAAGTLRE